MAIKRHMTGDVEIDELNRKGDQESEMGSLARIDGDIPDMEKRYAKAREYWAKAVALRKERGL